MDIKYINDDFRFLYRVSGVIFNKDKTKVLLFNCEGRNFYMLPGGKIKQKEESLISIKREIEEELGYKNLKYSFLAISEEFVEDKGYYNQQINLIYQGIFEGNIDKTKFKGLEGDWVNFEWIDVDKINNYEIFPNEIKKAIINPNKIYHFVENLTK